MIYKLKLILIIKFINYNEIFKHLVKIFFNYFIKLILKLFIIYNSLFYFY